MPGDDSEWLADVPPEHAPFLFIDRNLGVPTKAAYRAYLESVTLFQSVRPRLLPSSPPLTDAEASAVLDASAVLLLVNPAHQTGLNARKRLVLQGKLDSAQELRFTTALLTLREGAKQSILWHHRRWLLRRVHSPLPDHRSSPQYISSMDCEDTLYGLALRPDAFRDEFAAVERACETYARNYHAWAHRYECAAALVSLARTENGADSDEHLRLRAVLREEAAWIRLWIERHIADYSAAQYSCRLSSLIMEAGLYANPDAGFGPREGHLHAVELVRAYPTHESLWLYLRGVFSVDWSRKHVFEGGLGTPGDSFVKLALAVAEQLGTNGDAQPWGHIVRWLAWALWMVSVRGPIWVLLCAERLNLKDNEVEMDAAFVRRVAAAAEDVTLCSMSDLPAYLRSACDD